MIYLTLILSAIAGIVFILFFLRFLSGKTEPATKLIVTIALFAVFFYGMIMYGSFSQAHATFFEDSLLGFFSGVILGGFLYVIFHRRKNTT